MARVCARRMRVRRMLLLLLLLRVRVRLCMRRDGLGSTAGLHERGERMRRRSRRRGGRRRFISARLNLPPLLLLR